MLGSEVCLKLQMAENNAKEYIEAILKLFALISSLDMTQSHLVIETLRAGSGFCIFLIKKTRIWELWFCVLATF